MALSLAENIFSIILAVSVLFCMTGEPSLRSDDVQASINDVQRRPAIQGFKKMVPIGVNINP